MPAQHQPKPGLELKDFNQKWHHHMRALEERSPENTTPTSYESFVAEEFVSRYRGKSTTA